MYFTDIAPERGAVMIIELDSAAKVHVTEPLMLTFDASVHYRVAPGRKRTVCRKQVIRQVGVLQAERGDMQGV